ncbi:MAG: fumarylacetoacetate hydrolase family protein [Cellvibrionaceae bacterium]
MRKPVRLSTLFATVIILLVSSQLSAASDKYVRFEHKGEAHYGLLKGSTLTQVKGDLFSQHSIGTKTFELDKVTLLPATKPSKIIAVGLNYKSHNNSTKGANPRLFSKLTSSLTGHNTPIWLFPDSTNLHYEGELVVVIGKTASNITPAEASGVIFGVTAGNDVTDRSWQASDLQWLRGKGADSFSPIAPWLVTGLDYNNLLVETRLNGKVVQSERTTNLLFNVDEIVSYASRYFTLSPGDLIFTGTPGRTSAMKAGDIVEVEIENVGKLTNIVTQRKSLP